MDAGLCRNFFQVAVHEFEAFTTETWLTCCTKEENDPRDVCGFINKAMVFLGTRHAPLKRLSDFTPAMALVLCTRSQDRGLCPRAQELLAASEAQDHAATCDRSACHDALGTPANVDANTLPPKTNFDQFMDEWNKTGEVEPDVALL